MSRGCRLRNSRPLPWTPATGGLSLWSPALGDVGELVDGLVDQGIAFLLDLADVDIVDPLLVLVEENGPGRPLKLHLAQCFQEARRILDISTHGFDRLADGLGSYIGLLGPGVRSGLVLLEEGIHELAVGGRVQSVRVPLLINQI